MILTGSRPLSWAELIVLIKWFGLCMGMDRGQMSNLRKRLKGMWRAGWIGWIMGSGIVDLIDSEIAEIAGTNRLVSIDLKEKL